MPECSQRLSGAAPSRWALSLRRSYRRVLPGALALAIGDGQCAHARNRPLAQREGAAIVALARAHGVNGRHRDLDARYTAEPGGVSPAQHPSARGRLAAGAAVGPHTGKGTCELGLARSLLKGFRPGDVMLADTLYCNYFLIATLMAAGVDVLFEQNGSRITDMSTWPVAEHA